MAEDFVQIAPDSTGAKIRTRARTIGANAVEEQYVIIQEEKVVSAQVRACSFIVPGRGGTTQKLATLFNASGSTVLVRLNRVIVDVLITAAAGIAPTVFVPLVRVQRISAAPTGGGSITKSLRDTGGSSNASVTALCDATADGTVAATQLAATSVGTLHQVYSPRVLIVGTTPATTLYEPVDTVPFFVGEPDITLRASEGVAVTLDASVAAGNPTTNRWTCMFDWDEFTLP